MKITVDVDCTPEEARSFLGLPDLSPLHSLYIDQMKRAMSEGITPDMLESMMKSWAPFGEAGVTMWRQMFERMGGIAEK